jgi:hypothetical protein
MTIPEAGALVLGFVIGNLFMAFCMWLCADKAGDE